MCRLSNWPSTGSARIPGEERYTKRCEMPRASKQQFPSTFEAPLTKLSSGVRMNLLDLLGICAESVAGLQAIASIKSVASIYEGGQTVIDRPPWTGNSAIFAPLKRDAEKLSQALEALEPSFRDSFIKHGGDLTLSLQVLKDVARISDDVLLTSPKRRQGAPENIALREVVGKLRGVFLDFAAESSRTPKREHEFVRAVLVAAKILRLPAGTSDQPEEDISTQFDKSLRRLMNEATPAGNSASAKAAAREQIARRTVAREQLESRRSKKTKVQSKKGT